MPENSNNEIEIIEYELSPTSGSQKVSDKYSLSTIDDLLQISKDVKQEEEIRASIRREESQKVREVQKRIKEDSADDSTNAIAQQSIINVAEHMISLAYKVEKKIPLKSKQSEISQSCWQIRSCPDKNCLSYKAVNARCWYVSGQECGCRTHLGIPSCFDCHVFQSATKDPAIRIRETFFYILGALRQAEQKIKRARSENIELKVRVDDLLRPKGKKKKDRGKKQKLAIQLEKTTELEDKLDQRTGELKESNKSLRRTIKKLEESERIKTEFIANVTHELRTPLTSIMGFSKILLSGIDGELNENQTTDLTAINDSGQHLLEIINTILDLSKVEAGKMELFIEKFDIARILDEIVNSSHSLVVGKPVRIESVKRRGIPLIEADATKIRQIIYNLLSNAAKFTDEGTITVLLMSKKDKIILEITDTGIGIHKEDIEFVFKPFRQVEGSSAQKVAGTGLGLCLTKEYIEMHGGSIDVQSEVGVGSKFTVKLPVKAPAA